MKRSTAVCNVHKIANKIKRVNGLIGTPHAGFEAYKIRRAWVFGSVVKGSENPNDVDILIDAGAVGEFNRHRSMKCKSGYWRGQPLFAEWEAKKWLKSGMKKISIHLDSVDGEFSDIPATRVMIYPRFDFGDNK